MSHSDLVVSGKSIYESKELMARSCIYQLVNGRQGIAIFRSSFLKVFEVNVDPPLAIRLFHEDYICDPTRVVSFSNEVCIQQLVHFFSYHLLSLRYEASFLLFNRLIISVDT